MGGSRRNQHNNNDDTTYVIPPFDLSKVKNNSIVVLYGRRGSGKSTMLRHIMQQRCSIPYGLACSPTEEATGDLGHHMPSKYIWNDYEPDITIAMMEYQQRASQKHGKDRLPPAFLIYDDTMFDRRFSHGRETRQLFMNGRHYNIFTLVTAQYCMDLPPAIRANIDYVFMFREPIRANRLKLFANFGGIFPKYEHFEKVLMAATADHHAMVIDNTSMSDNIGCVVSRYLAPEHLPPFVMGSPAFWASAGKEGAAQYKQCEAEIKQWHQRQQQQRQRQQEASEQQQRQLALEKDAEQLHKHRQQNKREQQGQGQQQQGQGQQQQGQAARHQGQGQQQMAG